MEKPLKSASVGVNLNENGYEVCDEWAKIIFKFIFVSPDDKSGTKIYFIIFITSNEKKKMSWQDFSASVTASLELNLKVPLFKTLPTLPWIATDTYGDLTWVYCLHNPKHPSYRFHHLIFICPSNLFDYASKLE